MQAHYAMRAHYALEALDSYAIENDLGRLLGPRYARADDEARSLLREAFGAPADLAVVSNELHVRLDPLSAPRRTAAIAGLCEELTATKTIYPRTELTLVFSVKSSLWLPSDDLTMQGGLESGDGVRTPVDVPQAERRQRLAVSAHRGPRDPPELPGRDDLLADFHDQHRAVEHRRVWREPPSSENPLEDLGAATPGWAGHGASGTGPRPGFGSFALAVVAERGGVGPVLAEIFGLDRDEAGDLAQVPHRLLVNHRCHARSSERRRDHRYFLTTTSLRRVHELGGHTLMIWATAQSMSRGLLPDPSDSSGLASAEKLWSRSHQARAPNRRPGVPGRRAARNHAYRQLNPSPDPKRGNGDRHWPTAVSRFTP